MRLASHMIPLHLTTPLRSPPVRTHPPVDALEHLTLSLLEGLYFAPLINSTLPDIRALPSDEIMTNAYYALQEWAQTLMMEHWRSLSLLDYPLRLSLNLLMGLGKFLAGRIHQMSSQKSYLAAHPAWLYAHDSQHCPLCEDEPATFSHTILCSPAKATA